MFTFLYKKYLLGFVLTHDFSQYIRPFFNRLDDWQYKHYREAGCFGTHWDKSALPFNGTLLIKVVKGKDVPHDESDNTRHFLLVRIGYKNDYCEPVPCNHGEPRFDMTSYFVDGFNPNMLVEITVVKDGTIKDSMVGRVCVPVKELCDVREYHGWVALEDSRGNPAGWVYLSSRFRTKGDAGHAQLKKDAETELRNENGQYKRLLDGRNKNRARKRINMQSSAAGPITRVQHDNSAGNNSADVIIDVGVPPANAPLQTPKASLFSTITSTVLRFVPRPRK